jgi:ribulose-phosphate 3-epimerase
VNKSKVIIAPSLLSADFGRLKEEIQAVEAAGADWLHVDVMDGHFVPNITIGPDVVKAMKKYSTKPLDVHLMIADPARYAPRFVEAGADILSFHIEVAANPGWIIREIQKTAANLGRNVKVGLVLNPDTPASTIHEMINHIDLVTVMSVYPGFGGQKFIERALDKVEGILRMKPDILVEIDGGITLENIKLAAARGVRVFVAGTSVFHTKNYAASIAALRQNAEAAATGPGPNYGAEDAKRPNS